MGQSWLNDIGNPSMPSLSFLPSSSKSYPILSLPSSNQLNHLLFFASFLSLIPFLCNRIFYWIISHLVLMESIEQLFLNRRGVLPHRDIGQCLQKVLFVKFQRRGVCYRQMVDGGRNVAKHPTVHKKASHNKEFYLPEKQ